MTTRVVAEPFDKCDFYRLCDETKYVGFVVDKVLCDIITICKIKSEDPWIHSGKKQFYHKVSKEFNLRITKKYGAAGHGKGLIDAMSNLV